MMSGEFSTVVGEGIDRTVDATRANGELAAGSQPAPPIVAFEMVEPRQLNQAAADMIRALTAENLDLSNENTKLNERAERLKRLMADLQEDSKLVREFLQKELDVAQLRLLEIRESDPEKQLAVLRVALRRSEDTAQDLRERYDRAVLREQALRSENQNLHLDLSALRARFESFSGTMRAQVDALTKVVESQAAMLGGRSASGGRLKRGLLRNLPALVIAPIGLLLCQFAVGNYIDPTKSVGEGDLVAFAAGLVLLFLAMVWTVLFSTDADSNGN